jgi:hypothetical protein
VRVAHGGGVDEHGHARAVGTLDEQFDVPDALAVRSGLFARRRVVPAETIDDIDDVTGVIGLNVDRESLRSF